MFVEKAKEMAQAIEQLPYAIEQILEQKENIKRLAEAFVDMKGCFFLGRKFQSPIAFEGALKLKELSYIHAEGYAAGEMKHGPLALVDEYFPSFVLAPHDPVFEKTKSNIEELRARKGPVIVITDEENTELSRIANHVITVPKTIEALSPILTTIPLQLFAYYVAVTKGYDPDKPRNLAKSVTVE